MYGTRALQFCTVLCRWGCLFLSSRHTRDIGTNVLPILLLLGSRLMSSRWILQSGIHLPRTPHPTLKEDRPT
ncbi:uncharacterized protein P174DRAFT_438088 [Aspergillus novofumigatus IBT 16806]|uniref:Uncharacterized protein n=1 Tax=Aspergillus novofumigatus (strain IBT 16806) TaxID=1392255 RepID=A0A2I1CPV1_ASPN1|nr:uncharacterized protein P174DRAFT_438088 [Aspergillus novofumigatus IBT 16806]PKX99639.1 hypothetical protein P174DRAFT_438088 [Aspergillus novofumigatus IBT 16806]